MRLCKMASAILALLLLVSPILFAQSSQQDDRIVINRSDLPASLLAEIEAKQKIQQYSEYYGLGREVVEALNGGLEAVTDQTNRFAQTPVGKLMAVVIIWKVIGTDFVQLLLGPPLMVVWTSLFIWSYRKNCMPYAILHKVTEDKTKEYETINVGTYNDSEKWSHIILYFVGMGALLLVTLV